MTITEHRLPQLHMPDMLDDPGELLKVLDRLGLVTTQTPDARARLAAGQTIAAAVGRRFSEAQISAALDKFEVTRTDRIAIKLAMVQHRLMGH